MVREPEYISLKEAAQISGYTADYLGQLIRSGKLPGKQVFSNVAWMTTREALEEYASKDSKETISSPTVRERLISLENLSRVYGAIVWVAVAILVCITLFLAFVVASSIDERLEDNSLKTIEYD